MRHLTSSLNKNQGSQDDNITSAIALGSYVDIQSAGQWQTRFFDEIHTQSANPSTHLNGWVAYALVYVYGGKRRRMDVRVDGWMDGWRTSVARPETRTLGALELSLPCANALLERKAFKFLI